ncbi:MAG: Uma2 family endonuclease [Isosphaeraceae bacterium]
MTTPVSVSAPGAGTSAGGFTPEDLLTMPDAGRFELIGGNLVERHMSALSSFVAAQLVILLGAHCREHQLGWILDSEVGYRCFPWKPGRLRRADVSFIAAARYSVAQLSREGQVSIAPDLAVEVISPGDEVSELNRKLSDYRRAHVRLVWVIDPEARIVDVHALDGTLARLREGDELSGGDVIPGFRCPVAAVFPPAEEASPAEPAS